MKTNEEKIDEICHKEGKVLIIKEWLSALFFVAVIIVGIVYYKAISFAVTVPDPLLTMRYGRIAVATILITLSAFAIAIITGYFYNRFLSKKLDRLWEQKQLLF